MKVDIHKAFDTLNWEFLFEALRRMNFPVNFINCIRKCITSVMFSIKIKTAVSKDTLKVLLVSAKETLFPLTYSCLPWKCSLLVLGKLLALLSLNITGERKIFLSAT